MTVGYTSPYNTSGEMYAGRIGELTPPTYIQYLNSKIELQKEQGKSPTTYLLHKVFHSKQNNENIDENIKAIKLYNSSYNPDNSHKLLDNIASGTYVLVTDPIVITLFAIILFLFISKKTDSKSNLNLAE